MQNFYQENLKRVGALKAGDVVLVEQHSRTHKYVVVRTTKTQIMAKPNDRPSDNIRKFRIKDGKEIDNSIFPATLNTFVEETLAAQATQKKNDREATHIRNYMSANVMGRNSMEDELRKDLFAIVNKHKRRTAEELLNKFFGENTKENLWFLSSDDENKNKVFTFERPESVELAINEIVQLAGEQSSIWEPFKIWVADEIKKPGGVLVRKEKK
jgi:hypothetical protein